MKKHWQKLSLREKRLISICGTLLALVLVYTLILSPLETGIRNLQTAIPNSQNTLHWMQAADSKFQQLNQQEKPKNSASPANLLSTIQQSIKSAKFSTKVQISQTNRGNVNVNFDAVNFNEMMKWLINIWQQNSIHATKADITALQKTGSVKASLELATLN